MIAGGLAALLVMGCGNAANEPTTGTTNTQAVAHDAHQHEESSDALELDNGNRWKVNEEMKVFVQGGENLVQAYLADGGSDHAALARQVKEQNDQLIKSCTMQGKSHDELHKWLHPHIAMVKELANETDAAKASERVSELQHSYALYHQYFQ